MRKLSGFFLLVTLILMGCFGTREVEPPDSSSSQWVSPTDYNILLGNLKTAVSQLNTQNYLRCFAGDSLTFIPATSVNTGPHQSIFNNWSIQDEQAWFDNVVVDLNVLSGNSLTLQEVDLQTLSVETLRYIGDYELAFNHSDSLVPTTLLGQVEFILKINQYNEWEIHQWTDYETVDDSSWSLLKIEFVQ